MSDVYTEKKRPLPLSLLKLMRPKQWVKNGFLFATLLFSGNLFNIDLFALCVIGCILFSLTASCVYIINDIGDREKDRKHPKKCRRPLASGAVSVPQVVVLLAVLLIISFGASVMLNIWFAAVLLVYFVFNIFYSYILKHIAIVDVISVSVSYVLRVVAGAVIISCPLSPWILVCTFALALLIAIQKRRGELVSVTEGKSEGRRVLSYYSLDLLRDMAVCMGAVTITAYCLYTFQADVSAYMVLTVPFVIFGLLRYMLLAGTSGIGETPEEIVIRDKPMLVDMVFWATSCVIIIYLL